MFKNYNWHVEDNFMIYYLFYFVTASVSIGRPEETVGTGHGADDSSSK